MTDAAAPRITLTGADEATPLGELELLTRQFPEVEVGILLSLSPERRNRYPGLTWIRGAVERLGERCAVHVCGRAAKEAVLAYRLPWLGSAGRVQINGKVSGDELLAALRLFNVVITQYAENDEAANRLAGSSLSLGHQLLVDASGGRGLSPLEWRRPTTYRRVGFAGGLGEDNLARELPRIAAVATGAWWVDMETKLRDASDRFHVPTARACAEIFRWVMLASQEPVATGEKGDR